MMCHILLVVDSPWLSLMAFTTAVNVFTTFEWFAPVLPHRKCLKITMHWVDSLLIEMS